MKTKNSNNTRLTDAQIQVLLLGSNCKLSRSSAGWAYDDRKCVTDPVRVHSPATIRSLWKRGLLDSNFDDPRGVGRCLELDAVQNTDGARCANSPDVPNLQVWTSELGRKALEERGFLRSHENVVYLKTARNVSPA